MAILVSMLRGVNVGGRNKVPMEQLRALYADLGLKDPQSFIQSGNVVFETAKVPEAALADRIEAALEREFGFRPHVVLRSAQELRGVVARNPFVGRAEVTPDRLLVTFMKTDPGDAARAAVRAIPVLPEELVIEGSEMFVYYASGQGQTKMPTAKIDRACGVPGTARNWNSVLKLLAMAEVREKLNPRPVR